HRPRAAADGRRRRDPRPAAGPLPQRGAAVPDLRRALRDASVGDCQTGRTYARPGGRAMSASTTELLPTAPLEAFLDAHELGSGPLEATRIGDGASNLTYLVERDRARIVLRRPPPPPLPPSAHDMVREARVQ